MASDMCSEVMIVWRFVFAMFDVLLHDFLGFWGVLLLLLLSLLLLLLLYSILYYIYI